MSRPNSRVRLDRRQATAGILLLAADPRGLLGAVHSRFEFSQPHMGTLFRMVLYARDADAAAQASIAAFGRIAQLDAVLSDYRESSELMSLCRQAGGPPVKVSEDLFRVLWPAQEWAARTNGAFDVTVGALVQLWRRARRTREMPEAQRLAEALALTGYQKLHLDRKTRSARLARRGMRLDLGGIAKGFAADQAMAVLERQGIRAALVAAGGDIVVSDPPPALAGCVIAVAPLDASDPPPARRLWLRRAAVSTSGDAEQNVEIGGVRYSHIVDPRTGLGLVGRRSVTVVAPDEIGRAHV